VCETIVNKGNTDILKDWNTFYDRVAYSI
jgi:hypothetical protein